MADHADKSEEVLARWGAVAVIVVILCCSGLAGWVAYLVLR